jgi:hypothetical protein
MLESAPKDQEGDRESMHDLIRRLDSLILSSATILDDEDSDDIIDQIMYGASQYHITEPSHPLSHQASVQIDSF